MPTAKEVTKKQVFGRENFRRSKVVPLDIGDDCIVYIKSVKANTMIWYLGADENERIKNLGPLVCEALCDEAGVPIFEPGTDVTQEIDADLYMKIATAVAEMMNGASKPTTTSEGLSPVEESAEGKE